MLYIDALHQDQLMAPLQAQPCFPDYRLCISPDSVLLSIGTPS